MSVVMQSLIGSFLSFQVLTWTELDLELLRQSPSLLHAVPSESNHVDSVVFSRVREATDCNVAVPNRFYFKNPPSLRNQVKSPVQCL